MSRPSEVFDNYAKIALAKGIIKKGEDEAATQGKTHNPRFDSRTVKEIANLYNLKIDRPESMEYNRNIIEDAHPESVVLFQSHDKMNSLIENDQERQNIIINIMRKMPNGNLLQKKYAMSELAMSLIRVAMEMDNKNKEELRVLADACAQQLKKQGFDPMDFLKEKGGDALDAGTGAAVGAIAGGLLGVFGGPVTITGGAMAGAALGGALAAIFKTSPQAKNLVINSEIARTELADVIKDKPGDPLLQQLDVALAHIQGTAGSYSSLVDKMHMPHATQNDGHNVQVVANQYFTEISRLNILIGTFLANAKSGNYAPNEADWWSKIKAPVQAVVGDDVNDEVKALETLQGVIRNTQSGINTAMVEAQNVAAQAQSPAAPAVESPAQKSPETDWMDRLNDLESGISELGKGK